MARSRIDKAKTTAHPTAGPRLIPRVGNLRTHSRAPVAAGIRGIEFTSALQGPAPLSKSPLAGVVERRGERQ
jgi:hypothetical protein